jgi:hypothetical protein
VSASCCRLGGVCCVSEDGCPADLFLGKLGAVASDHTQQPGGRAMSRSFSRNAIARLRDQRVSLTIRAALENVRSRAIPQRLGFREEGVLREAERVGDGYLDIVVYSMLGTEWRSSADAADRAG